MRWSSRRRSGRIGDILEGAEAGGHAVHDGMVAHRTFHPFARAAHGRRAWKWRDGPDTFARHGHDPIDRQRRAINLYRSGHALSPFSVRDGWNAVRGLPARSLRTSSSRHGHLHRSCLRQVGLTVLSCDRLLLFLQLAAEDEVLDRHLTLFKLIASHQDRDGDTLTIGVLQLLAGTLLFAEIHLGVDAGLPELTCETLVVGESSPVP